MGSVGDDCLGPVCPVEVEVEVHRAVQTSLYVRSGQGVV